MAEDISSNKSEQRRLLSSFEALVRSQANLAGSSLENLAERFHGQWIAADRPWLVFHAKGMAVEDGEIQEFDAAEARWLVVLFMAGLHRIRIDKAYTVGPRPGPGPKVAQKLNETPKRALCSS